MFECVIGMRGEDVNGCILAVRIIAMANILGLHGPGQDPLDHSFGMDPIEAVTK